MKKTILIFLVGITNCFGQNFIDENKIEELLNAHKVNISEPIKFRNGELITEDKMHGLNGEVAFHNQITIDLKEIAGIETEYYEKTNIYNIKFISGSEKSILETQLGTKDLLKKKSSRINLRHVDSKVFSELISVLNSYRE
jgi:hypothetical protein